MQLFGSDEDEAKDVQVPVDNSQCEVFKDILYYKDSKSELHTLDILTPEGIDASQKLPVVIHCHGGGWQRGHKDHSFYGAPFMGKAFAKRGFVCVLVNYRKSKHPSAVEDVARAIKWVRDNIETYHGDNEKIFLSGHSAGAHLVSLVASEPSYVNAIGGDVSYIKGCIVISGIYNVGTPLSENEDDFFHVMYRKFYVDPTFGSDRDGWSLASPYFHVANAADHTKIPPFVIFNACFDFGLEYDGRKFFDLLKAKGVPIVQYYTIQNTHHQSVTKSDEVVDYRDRKSVV